MQLRLFFRLLGLLIAVGLVSTVARADSVASGSFNIGGTVYVSSSTTDFGYLSPPPPGDQMAAVISPETGAFVSLTPGTTVSILNIPASPNGSVSNWVVLPDGINLNLTSMPAPALSACSTTTVTVGTQCLLSSSLPFVLTQSVAGVILKFDTDGNAYSGSLSGGSSPFTALFTSITGFSTIGQAESYFDTNGNLPASGYSADFTVTPAAATPEPSTLISSITGLLFAGLPLVSRRRRLGRN